MAISAFLRERKKHNQMKTDHKDIRRQKAISMYIHTKLHPESSKWCINENKITSPKGITYTLKSNELQEINEKLTSK